MEQSINCLYFFCKMPNFHGLKSDIYQVFSATDFKKYVCVIYLIETLIYMPGIMIYSHMISNDEILSYNYY